jgi:hypothetical protein
MIIIKRTVNFSLNSNHSSNHLDENSIYFRAERVMIVKVLELVNLGGETSELLLSYVLEVLQKLDLFENVIAMSADTNFGGKKRKGKNFSMGCRQFFEPS